jgi:general stress protein 26
MDDVRKKLVEALRRFDTLMVTTKATNGTIHARPMAVADVDDSGEVWFVTPKESGKIVEVESNAEALVTGQRGEGGEPSSCYVSLSGVLDIIHDPQKIVALWKPSWDSWFPRGRDDDDAVLLRLRPSVGEYWLSSGLSGVRYVFEATRALFNGTAPRDQDVDHAKVPL